MGIAFAICRAVKIKSLSALKSHAGHAARTHETLNANTTLTPLNQVLVGSGDPAADAEARMAALETPPRKNAVLAIDVLLTASPEYFRPDFPEMSGAYELSRLDQFNERALTWAQEYFGKENVVSVFCHLDESTPHLSLTVVPVDDTPRKKGARIRLNAARWLDGKAKMQEMQDSFAAAVTNLGLERGERGSRAQHQSVQKYYGQIKRYPELRAENVIFKQEVRNATERRRTMHHGNSPHSFLCDAQE